MAGDWIPIETSTPRKFEVIMIAKSLNVSRREVMGLLVEFWGWCQEQTVDGHVDAHVDACEEMLELPKGFCAAMASVKWLEVTEKGFTIPHWDRLLSSGAKSRKQKNVRQQNWRNSKAESAENVDAHVDGNVGACAPLEKRREENRREEEERSPFSPLTLLDVKRVCDSYPIQVEMRNAENSVRSALTRIRGRGIEDAAGWLVERIKQWAESDAGKKSSKTLKWWLEDGKYDDDQKRWGEKKKPEIGLDLDKPVYRDPTIEELMAEQAARVKPDAKTEAIFERNTWHGKRTTGKPQGVAGGVAEAAGDDGSQVQG